MSSREPPSRDTVFAYHAQKRALVICDPADERRLLLVTTSELRRAGWYAMDAELAKRLPRYDAPQVVLTGIN